MKVIFEGKRDLFANLWLGQQSDYDFQPYHIIYIDMSGTNTENAEELKLSLLNQIKLLTSVR